MFKHSAKPALHHADGKITIYTESGDLSRDPVTLVDFHGGRFLVKDVGPTSYRAPDMIRCLVLNSIGLSRTAIARKTYRSPDTVKTQLSRSYKQLHAKNGAQAVRAAFNTALFEIVEPIDASNVPVTESQLAIIDTFSQGFNKKQAASELGMSFDALRTRHQAMMRETETSLHPEVATTYAMLAGLLELGVPLSQPDQQLAS